MIRSRRFRAFTSLIVLLVLALGPTEGLAQSRRDVEEKKARVDAAVAELRQVDADRDAAIEKYQLLSARLEDLTYRTLLLTDRVREYEGEVNVLRSQIKERAVRAYMSGGIDDLELIFQAGSYNDVVTGQQVMAHAVTKDMTKLDRLDATRREMERLRVELESDQDEMATVTAEREDVVASLDALWELRDEAFHEADDEYREALAAYEAEVARRRAAELARQQGSAAGVPGEATPNFLCPVQGPHRFINDWGFPRSGGRTHKGTDVFAARGVNLVAVANGTIRLSNGGLGGRAVWLNADHGTSYYYAHLDGWASGLETGMRVQRGQLVGYVGDSGNARGGATHLHFQLHPGGGAPVNPYPTLTRSC